MADILIRGMYKPKNCMFCPCMDREYGSCNITGTVHRRELLHLSADDCPLVELPEHGDLIDRDAFREENEYYLHREFINPKYEDTLDDLLKDAPVIAPASKEETE